MALNYVQATRIAVLVGRMMAVLLAMWGIFLWTVGGGGIIPLLIAFFVYVGGGAERRPSKAVLRHHQASEALPTDAVNLYASEELSRRRSDHEQLSDRFRRLRLGRLLHRRADAGA